MRRLGFLLFVAFLALLVTGLPTRRAVAQNFSARDLIAGVNALRISQGLAPYTIDGGLMAYAQEHSDYQAKIGQSTHTHSDGNSPLAHGVQENVASGTSSFMTVDLIIYQIWGDPVHVRTMTGYASGTVGAGLAIKGDMLYVTLNVRPSGASTSSGSGSAAASPVATSIPLQALVTNTPQPDGSIVHQVGYGQSLWSIAIAYGVKINDIRALNGLAPDSTDIYAGQKLLIRPAGTVIASATPATPTSPTSLTSPATATPSSTMALRLIRTSRPTTNAAAISNNPPASSPTLMPKQPETTRPATAKGEANQSTKNWRSVAIWAAFLGAAVLLVLFILSFRK